MYNTRLCAWTAIWTFVQLDMFHTQIETEGIIIESVISVVLKYFSIGIFQRF